MRDSCQVADAPEELAPSTFSVEALIIIPGCAAARPGVIAVAARTCHARDVRVAWAGPGSSPACPTPAQSSHFVALRPMSVFPMGSRDTHGVFRRLLLAGIRRARLAGRAGSRGVAAQAADVSATRGEGVRDLQIDVGGLSRRRHRRRSRRSTHTTPPPTTRAACQPAFGDLTIGSTSGIDDIGQAGSRRARSAARGAERALRAHADTLQPVAVRSHRRQSLLCAERAARSPASAARLARDRLPDGIDRREDARGSMSRASRAARSAVLHAHGRREARDRRRVRTATMGLVGVHIAQKTPSRPAVDLVVVRAARHRAAGVAGFAGLVCAQRRHARRRCPKRIRCRSCRSRRSR